MIRMSRLADYAVVILCHMSEGESNMRALSARALSEYTDISESAIMKILKLLVRAEIVRSVRGSKGGYQVSYPPHQITILHIVAAIDGGVSITQCSPTLAPSCACAFEAQCIAKKGFARINAALQETLASFTLADFLTPTQQIRPKDYYVAN